MNRLRTYRGGPFTGVIAALLVLLSIAGGGWGDEPGKNAPSSKAEGPAASAPGEAEKPAQPSVPLIATVKVRGNQAISADVIIDQVKAILKPGAELTKQRIAEAEKAVMAMGYFDRVAISYEITDKGAEVTITVVERQRIEAVTFVGNTVLTDEELADAILTRPGHLVDSEVIAKDVTRILGAYQRKGYLCNVASADVDEFGVLTFVINEMRVEGYEIEGLKRTRKWIVAKQIKLRPGELYHDTLIREQVVRLRALGLFEDVRVEPRPGKIDPENSIIIVFHCKERRTGQVAFQLGYSSLDKLVVAVGVSEANFRGRAERISLAAEFFGRSTYQFSFMEPYLFGGDTSLELSLFDTERRRQFIGGTMVSTASDRFDERRRGGYIQLARPLGERTRLSLRIRNEEVSSAFFQGVRTVPAPTVETSKVATSQVNWYLGGRGSKGRQVIPPDFAGPGPGKRVGWPVVAAPLHPGGRLSSISIGLIQDFRDDPMDPTRGTYRSISVENAGSFMGGDNDFRQIVGELRAYRPFGKRAVIATRLMAGTSFGDLPLFEAFSVGGANTLRGYEEDRFRGRKFVLFNAEYRHRVTKNLTGVLFVDVGDAFGGVFRTPIPGFEIGAEDQDLNAHYGVGIGVRVKTQIGPLRLDVGFGEEGSRAHFNFGHTF